MALTPTPSSQQLMSSFHPNPFTTISPLAWRS